MNYLQQYLQFIKQTQGYTATTPPGYPDAGKVTTYPATQFDGGIRNTAIFADVNSYADNFTWFLASLSVLTNVNWLYDSPTNYSYFSIPYILERFNYYNMYNNSLVSSTKFEPTDIVFFPKLQLVGAMTSETEIGIFLQEFIGKNTTSAQIVPITDIGDGHEFIQIYHNYGI